MQTLAEPAPITIDSPTSSPTASPTSWADDDPRWETLSFRVVTRDVKSRLDELQRDLAGLAQPGAAPSYRDVIEDALALMRRAQIVLRTPDATDATSAA